MIKDQVRKARATLEDQAGPQGTELGLSMSGLEARCWACKPAMSPLGGAG